MQQAAYDFALFEPSHAPAKKIKAPLRAVDGGKAKKGGFKTMLVNITNVLALGLFVALALLLIQSKATITELTAQQQKTQNEITAAQSNYNYLNSELNRRTNMANVEDIANRLGLMKMDDSQITYVRLEDSSELIATESPVQKWTDWLKAAVLSVMETLDP